MIQFFIKADNADLKKVPYTNYSMSRQWKYGDNLYQNREYSIRNPMKEMKKFFLLFPKMQIKSFIVNLGQIESFNTKEISLTGGAVPIPICRQYYNSFLAK